MESAAKPARQLGGAELARYWWVWLVTGVVWLIVALVVLQFDQASVTTVGVIVGLMFLATGFGQFAVAALAERLRWLYVIFGVLLIAAGVLALVNPKETFAGIADILGFLFLLVGIIWTIAAFAEREERGLWWFRLIAGILMIVLAFWTGGQFFIEKAYLLLVFAGVCALLHGFTDIVRAFQIRKLSGPTGELSGSPQIGPRGQR